MSEEEYLEPVSIRDAEQWRHAYAMGCGLAQGAEMQVKRLLQQLIDTTYDRDRLKRICDRHGLDKPDPELAKTIKDL